MPRSTCASVFSGPSAPAAGTTDRGEAIPGMRSPRTPEAAGRGTASGRRPLPWRTTCWCHRPSQEQSRCHRLTAERSAAFAFAVLAALATAAAAADPAGRVGSDAGLLAAGAGAGPDAGAEAAERGWWEVARREWRADMARAAERTVVPADAAARAGAAAARLARLDAVEAAIAREAEARAAAAATVWPADWSPAWRIVNATRPQAAGIGIAAGLVLWNSGRALHGARVPDGRPPWPAGANDRDTTLFPRGLSAAGRAATTAATAAAPAPCVVGGRGYAVLALADGSERLVCVDLSPASEGRLVWAVDAAAVPPGVADVERRAAGATAIAFDGPPTADRDLCLIVLRIVPDRGGLFLAAFNAADGRLAWVRPAGRAVTSAGDDLARGRRRPCLAEDRIVLVTHAGTVLAFDRDGAPAWTTTVPATATAAAPAPGPFAAASSPPIDAVFAGGRIVAAPRDATGVMALDPWSGDVAWHWSRGEERVEHVLGASGDGVLVATAAIDGQARLQRIALADGREVAARDAAPPDQHAWRSAGPGVVIDASVLWPLSRADSSRAGEGPVIEVLDARSLERRREPLHLPAGDGGGVALAATSGAVACAVGAEIICLSPGAPRPDHAPTVSP